MEFEVHCPLDNGTLIAPYDYVNEVYRLFHYSKFGDFCRDYHCEKCRGCYDSNAFFDAEEGNFRQLNQNAQRNVNRWKSELEERRKAIKKVSEQHNSRIRELEGILDLVERQEEAQLSLFN